MKTILLKLRAPGVRKREVIDRAMAGYGAAFSLLFSAAQPRLSEIRAFAAAPGGSTANRLSKWIAAELGGALDGVQVQPFRDSLFLDLAYTLLGRARLEQTRPIAGGAQLAAGNPRPLYFCRYDTKRSWCLLYDAQKQRFYAKLYVMNAQNALDASPAGEPKLLHVHPSGGLLRSHGSRVTYLVVPLSFGEWQFGFLRQALENPDMLRTAKLMRRGDEYFLAVSVETAQQEKIATRTYLGVARALGSALTAAVADGTGALLATEALMPASEMRQGGVPEEARLHMLANAVVALAVKMRAQVVVQNLTRVGDRLSWLGRTDHCEPPLGCRAYNRLAAILDYKLADAGLPKPVRVSSLHIFSACPVCGFVSQGSRFAKNLFICTQCGYSSGVDALGGHNLAVKLLKYRSTPLKISVTYEGDRVLFTNSLIGFSLTKQAEECRTADIKRVVLQEIRAHLNAPAGKPQSKKRAGIALKLAAGDAYDRIELV